MIAMIAVIAIIWMIAMIANIAISAVIAVIAIIGVIVGALLVLCEYGQSCQFLAVDRFYCLTMVSPKAGLGVLLGTPVVDAVEQKKERSTERERRALQRAGNVIRSEAHFLHGLHCVAAAPLGSVGSCGEGAVIAKIAVIAVIAMIEILRGRRGAHRSPR